jgi:hypothetical protein
MCTKEHYQRVVTRRVVAAVRTSVKHCRTECIPRAAISDWCTRRCVALATCPRYVKKNVLEIVSAATGFTRFGRLAPNLLNVQRSRSRRISTARRDTYFEIPIFKQEKR